MNRKSKVKKSCILYNLLMVLWIIMAAGCHSGSNNHSGKNNSGKVVSAYYKYFQGNSGNQKIILQLIKFHNKYEGIYINDSIGKPLEATGERDSTGQLVLVTYNHYNPVDTLKGDFLQAGVFQGSEVDTSGNRRSFTFQEIYPPGTYRWLVYTLSDSLAFDSSQKNSPQARARMLLLWPVKKGMTSLQEKILTDSISQYYCGINTPLSDPEKVLQSPVDTFFTQYKNFKSTLKGSGYEGMGATFNWDSDLDMKLLWNADSIISIAFQSYQYTGGAHGISNTLLRVFDLRSHKVVGINDVFKSGYGLTLRNVLEQALRKEYNIPDNSPLNGDNGILFDKHLALTKNFYITGKGIGFVYNPYEVAPYYVGQIELYVPFEKIKSIVQPDYLHE